MLREIKCKVGLHGIVNWSLIILLIIVSLWAGKGLFKYSVFSTHDGLHHISRIYDAMQTIKEGHFPLRWAGSLNFMCGAPIFNFFYPLIYYMAIAVNYFTGNVVNTIKIINLISLVCGTVFFYLWILTETKNKVAAFTASFTYLFAPYRFLLIFVRGSPEYLAYAILPMVLYFYSIGFSEKRIGRLILLSFLAAISGALLAISHNFTVMFLMPIVLIYLLLKIVSERMFDWKKIVLIFFSYASSFGVASFFILPAILEKKFTQIGKQNIINYWEHFPTLLQLIRSKWDYFYSSPGVTEDGMSFMLGYAQWLIVGFGLLFVVVRLVKFRFGLVRLIGNDLIIIYFLILSLGTIYLVLPWSLPVWRAVPLLQEIQFSWRLLGVAVFSISALVGYLLVKIDNRKLLVALGTLFCLFAYAGNRNNLLPMPVADFDIWRFADFEKLHPHRNSSTTLGNDILGPNAKESCSFDTPIISQNGEREIKVQILERKNTFGEIRFVLGLQNLTGNKIVLGLSYFPDLYDFHLNGEREFDYNDCEGRVCFGPNVFNEGPNVLTWKIRQTPIESLSNYISITFIAFWLILLAFRKKIAGGVTRRDIIKLASLVLVLSLFFYFRFYHLTERTIFNWDQERDANVIKSILSGNLTLIGPRVFGPEGFFLPPYFYYILTPFYLLSDLSPYAIIYFLVFYNLFLAFYGLVVLKKLFGFWPSVLFLALWAIAPSVVAGDIISWNPILIPALFLTMIWTLYKTYEKDNLLWWLLTGVVFGLGISFHIQFVFYVFLIFPFLFKEKISQKIFKKILVVISGLIFVFLPLLLFDIRHGFLNIKLLIAFQTGSTKSWSAFIPVLNNYFSSFVGVKSVNLVGIIFYVLILFSIIYLVIENRKVYNKLLFLGFLNIWIIFPLIFSLYGYRPSEYYFSFLTPLILLSLASAIFMLIQRNKKSLYILIPVMFFLVTSMFNQAVKSVKTDNKSLYYKNKVVRFVSAATKNTVPLNVSFTVPLNEDTGFRYLLNYYNVNDSGDFRDPLIQIVYPYRELSGVFWVGQYGVQFPKDWLGSVWKVD